MGAQLPRRGPRRGRVAGQRPGPGGQHLRRHVGGGAQVAQAGGRAAPAQPERAPGGDRLLRRAGAAGGRRPLRRRPGGRQRRQGSAGGAGRDRAGRAGHAGAGRRSGRRPRVPRGAHARVRQGAGRLPQPVQLLRGHHRARRGAQPHGRGGYRRGARPRGGRDDRGGAVRRAPGRLRLGPRARSVELWSGACCAPRRCRACGCRRSSRGTCRAISASCGASRRAGSCPTCTCRCRAAAIRCCAAWRAAA